MNWMNVITIALVLIFLWMRFAPGDDVSGIDMTNAVILDVRTPTEFAEGHVNGAINIPVQSLQQESLETIATKERPIVVYCRSGARASSARQTLTSWGYKNVFNLKTQAGVESALQKRKQ